MLNDRFDVHLNRPVNELDHLYASVFEATSKEHSGQVSHAYIIKGRYPARLDVLDFILKQEIPNFLPARDYGIVTSPDGEQNMVILIAKPAVAPLMMRHQGRRPPVTEEVIRKYILRPLVLALKVLHAQGITHNNIRADNVFWQGMETGEAVLGECITTMPGTIQPMIYETIERGMAQPTGRGEGLLSDDVYALGMLVAILFRGNDPMFGKSDREIIDEKVTRTTFGMMTEGVQLSSSMSEFLRATLQDDPRGRWTIEQVHMWLIGNNVGLRPASMSRKANRVLEFNGNKYIYPRLLARDLFDNPAEAVTLIESGGLVKWLERCMNDRQVLDTVQAAINRINYNNKSPGYEDRMLSLISMALDPCAPIRYKEIRILPEGIGCALTDGIVRDQSLQSYAECIRDKLAWLWLGYKENEEHDERNLSKVFDNLSKNILRRGIDYGLERCLYELMHDIPCLSPFLAGHYVLNCQQLLLTLEKIGEDKSRPQQPIDRHIAAFISLRDPRDNSLLMVLLEGGDMMKRSLALITLFQGLQKRYQVSQLVNMIDWLAKDIDLVGNRFHNRKRQRDVTKAIQTESKTGSLTRILSLIDSPSDITRDRVDFEQARLQYERLEKEYEQISTNLKKNAVFGQSTGRQIAAVISGVMGGMFMAATLLAKIVHFRGGF